MFCPSCGTQMADGMPTCISCGWTEVRPHTSIEDDPAMRLLLPVGRSVWAILAGYFGLFSVLFFPAPLSLLFGILALRDIKKHPEKGGKGRAIFGIVMGAIFTLFLLFFIFIGVAASFE